MMNIRASPPILLQSPSPSIDRGKAMVKCSIDDHKTSKVVERYVFSGLAASLLFVSNTDQVIIELLPYDIDMVSALDLPRRQNLCQLASAMTLPIDEGREKLMMMMGMTAKNFDPIRYSGRWFEVASLKRGFAGQGQEDCHCTQGVYTFDTEARAIQVDTFCVHGAPDGYITGIRGRVQCVSDGKLTKTETDLEREEMIKEKCYLRFPTLPFIPKQPYDVIDTDYDNFALVSGAKDKSFIQIYSRTPNPGHEFIEKYKTILGNFGYDSSSIKDTPQDCQAMSDSQLKAMMSMPGLQNAFTNQFPDLQLNSSVQFDPFTSVFETLRKLVQLYFK